jgi:hypothetical protein
MADVLGNVYGSLLITRAPVPATCNKAGANYKSEVTHLEYSPREAFDEWLAICDAVVACGGDALFSLEEADQLLLDRGDLVVDASGAIRPQGSDEVLASMDDILTGRVFTANGPWVTVVGDTVRAVMPHMLPHRRAEAPYYRDLLARIAELGGYQLDVAECPDRWEGMADVAAVGDKVVLTYAVSGHYDEATEPKSPRSSRAGITFAADHAGVPEEARVYAELVYPHFHGDTVHFGARPTNRDPVLFHYAGGLWGDEATRVREAVGADNILPISRADAVDEYAGNSRQVESGLLVPDGVSAEFEESARSIGLTVHRLRLRELFGKAGGGPGCATLYLPANLELPADAPVRYSVRRDELRAYRERVPEVLRVEPGFFADKQRG